MGETHEIPHHNLADFEPCLGYATEGQAHPLHSTVGKNPHGMAEMGKFDHLEERLRDIKGGEDYAFANLEELFLVPNVVILP